MKTKIIGILVCMLLMSIIPGSSLIAKSENNCISNPNKGFGSEIVLEPISDAYIWELFPSENYGDMWELHVNSLNGQQYKSYLKFNLVGIPSSATINYARLELYITGVDYDPTQRAFNCNRVTENWNELTITWDDYAEYTDIITDDSQVPFNPMGEWMEWQVTSDVQKFVNEVYDNFGWIVWDPELQESNGAGVWYDSREVSNPERRPKLTIGYNTPPDKPSISGPTNGPEDTPLYFTFTSTDPDGDDISYYVDWGDHQSTGWTTFKPSGESYETSHIWENIGIYIIKAKAKDPDGLVSLETSLTISIPRNKPINFNILEWFFERFPNLFPSLRQLLGL